jgi:hypothetical protein
MRPIKFLRGCLVGNHWREPGQLAALDPVIAGELIAAGAAEPHERGPTPAPAMPDEAPADANPDRDHAGRKPGRQPGRRQDSPAG